MAGAGFFARRSEKGITGNIYSGLHEFPDMGFLLHVLRREDLFVDVGANVGSYTILACGAVGARGVAIEPVPSTFQRLCENVGLNHAEGRVQCLNIGVGRQSETMKFTSRLDAINHAVAENEPAGDTVDVQVRRLDSVLDGMNPVLIKIDVEGFETPVLEGAAAVLKRESLHAIIMELNGSGSRYGYNEDRILELMRQSGFASCAYDPLHRSLTDLNGKNANSGNTIFVRDKDFVLERINSAPPVTVLGKTF